MLLLRAAVILCFAASLPFASPVRADQEPQPIRKSPVVAHVIGDSVLLGARQQLQTMGLRVDAVEGRQPGRLATTLNKLPDDGLPVVIHLGTNGPFTRQHCRDVHRLVQGKRDVVMVTVSAPRPWIRVSNTNIRACASQVKGSSASLVAWHRIANSSTELLYDDAIHLTPRGASVLVSEVSKGLGLCLGHGSVSANRREAQVGKSCAGSDVHIRMSGV